MHWMLLGRRSLRRCHPPPERARHYPRVCVDRPVAGAPGLQAAAGLAVPVGFVAGQRLQLRLRRRLHRGAAEKRRRLQLPARRRARAAEGGHERLRAPGRRCPPHLLHLRAWRRGPDGDLPVPRPRSVGQERGRARVPPGVVAPPRRVRDALSRAVTVVGTTVEPEILRGTASERASRRAFYGVSAMLFVISATATVVWSASMSAMGGMPMPGGWTMSMAWTPMQGLTWVAAAAWFIGMWVVMMMAMMLPSLVPMLRRYRRSVGI